jgi:hypothetical protein
MKVELTDDEYVFTIIGTVFIVVVVCITIGAMSGCPGT